MTNCSKLVFLLSYTFGAPVRGTAVITISIAGDDSAKKVLNATVSPLLMFENSPAKLSHGRLQEFSGRSEVSFFTAFFPSWSSSENVNVDVNFTESLTGQWRSANAVISIERLDYKLTQITPVAETFKPGFPFTVQFRLTNIEGQPIPPSTKKAQLKELKFYNKRASWGIRIDGVDSMDIAVNPDATGLMAFNLTTPKESRRIEFVIFYGERSLSPSFKGLESPSNSFLQVKQLNAFARSGESLELLVDSTTHEDEPFLITVTFILLSNVGLLEDAKMAVFADFVEK